MTLISFSRKKNNNNNNKKKALWMSHFVPKMSPNPPPPKKKKKKKLTAPYLLNQMIDSGQTSCIIAFYSYNIWFTFGDLCPVFKVNTLLRLLKWALAALYRLNQWVDIDQTCTETSLRQRKEVIKFWWTLSHFQGHISTVNIQFWPNKACLHPISWTKWWIPTKHRVMYHWDS